MSLGLIRVGGFGWTNEFGFTLLPLLQGNQSGKFLKLELNLLDRIKDINLSLRICGSISQVPNFIKNKSHVQGYTPLILFEGIRLGVDSILAR